MQNSKDLVIPEVKINSILKKTKNEDFELKSIYFLEKENFKNYLSKKYSLNYTNEMYNTLQKVFIDLKVETSNDFKKVIDENKINQRAGSTSFRVFLNYLGDKDLIDEDILIKLKKKIKLNINSNIDTFIPTIDEIDKSFKIISEKYSKDYEIFYKLIFESGCRPIELEEFILRFDLSKVEYYENIVVYRNFYLRNTKNSYYLFFSKDTFEKFLLLDRNYNSNIIYSFREKISRDSQIISLKYLRKYHFTQMIKAGIDFEIANFIQGRTSRNIGFNHYLAKKEIAVKEYGKVI